MFKSHLISLLVKDTKNGRGLFPARFYLCLCNCGAATEELQYSAVDDYDNYKYWFKHMPSNEYFLAESVMRMVDAVGRTIRTDSGNKTEDYTLRCGIVADDAVCVVVHNGIARTVKMGRQKTLGNGHAHPIGEALSQWASCCLNTNFHIIFRMSWGQAAPLPESLHFFHRHLIASQMLQRIQ